MLPADVVDLGRLHQIRQQKLAYAATVEVQKAWARLAPGDIQGSWDRIVGPAVMTLVTHAQIEAARGSDDYVSRTVRLEGGTPAPAGQVPSSAFAGVASDGRPLESLLSYPLFQVQAFVRGGSPIAQALGIGARHLSRIVGTQVQDAARTSTGVAMVNDRRVAGYIRVVSAGACSRCVVLAGRWYSYNAGFARHPHCFPAGVVVSGPRSLAATRRLYQGELVVIRTASGQELPVTGNHPILTDRGWIPASLLQEGDNVVRSTRSQGAGALMVPNEDQMPSLIEDCWRPDGVMPLLHMPTTAEHFHGDGGHGDVDVVLQDGLLGCRPEPAHGQFAEQEELARRITQALSLALSRAGNEFVKRLLRATQSHIRRQGMLASLVGSHPLVPDLAGGLGVPDLHARSLKSQSDRWPTNAETQAEGYLAFAREVGIDDNRVGQRHPLSRWDAPDGPLTKENRAAYASRGTDLGLRLAGQVEIDRVVQARKVSWSGHVYNLTSAEGWYSANGLIVSNCSCTSAPATREIEPQSPKALFDAMTPEQLRKAGWSDADVKAINDGGDLYQVTNAHRDLRSVSIAGQQLQTTLQGATRRGIAGKRLGAAKGKTAIRLTPESIYAEADRLGWSRDETIRQLARFGYIR